MAYYQFADDYVDTLWDCFHKWVERDLKGIEQKSWWWHAKYEIACEHPIKSQQPVKWMQKNGVVRVSKVCFVCGEKRDFGVKKRDYNLAELEWLEDCGIEEIRQQLKEQEQLQAEILTEHWQKKREQIAVTTKNENLIAPDYTADSDAWWARYSNYLHSKEWKELRLKVLERDDYTCQACMKRRATDVHHCDYAIYNATGATPAYDVVAVCRTCHEYITQAQRAMRVQERVFFKNGRFVPQRII